MAQFQQRVAAFWCALVLLQQFDIILTMNIIDMRRNERVHDKADKSGTNSFESRINDFKKTVNKNNMADVQWDEIRSKISTIITERSKFAIAAETVDDATVNSFNMPSLDQRIPVDTWNDAKLDTTKIHLPNNSTDRDRRAINDIDEFGVMNAIKTTAQTILEQDANVTRKIMDWIPSCNSNANESSVKTFWKQKPMLYPMYLTISAVVYSLIECQIMMEERVSELLQIIDSDDVISFLEVMNSDDLISMHNGTGNDDMGVPENDMVDPEGPENTLEYAALNMMAYNFGKIQEMSNIFDHLNESDPDVLSQFSNGSLDDLDDIITEHDTISAMLNDQETVQRSRKKRHAFANKKPSLEREHFDVIREMKKFKLHNHPIGPTIAYKNAKHNIAEKFNDHQQRTGKHHQHQYDKIVNHVTRHRARRSTVLNIEDLSFFAIRDRESCRVLSLNSETGTPRLLIMADTDYDNITEQLWYQDGDHIVHATTGLLLSSHPSSRLGLDFERNDTNQRWMLEGNSTLMTVGNDSNMQLVVDPDESGNVSISEDEGGQGGNWEFAPFTSQGLSPCGLKVQESYFVIQHNQNPCYTLCAANESMSADSFDLVFKHYDFDRPGPCSWYEKGNRFVNVAFENVTIYTYLQNQEVFLNEWDVLQENALTWIFSGDEVVRLNATFNRDTHARVQPSQIELRELWKTLTPGPKF